jgi:HEAT repeat protein
MTRRRIAALLSAGALALPASRLHAQTLGARVDAAPPGYVQFSFAARPGICGNGRSYIQTSPGNVNGTINSSYSETLRIDPCEPGPVRVLLDRADRQVIAVQTFVGPIAELSGVTDLGRIAPQQAVDYLLGLAVKSDGRVGRDAIFPATLADSAVSLEALVAIGRNQQLPRDTRTRALTYAGRSDRLPTIPARVTDALLAVARDESDNLEVRRQALRTLGTLDHGAGIAPLIDVVRQTPSAWLAKEGMSALASSGDPRARDALRVAVKRDDLSDEALSVAIRALGQQYATPQDAALLRSRYAALHSDRSREAVFNAVADVGGADNVKWLLDLARNESETTAQRRKALEQATRAGAPVAELVRMYDVVDPYELKDALVSIYARSGERPALDKLIAIVTNETNVNVRRRAISALTSSDDPRVKGVLKDLIAR